MRWLRRGFWFTLSGTLAIAVWAGIFFGTAFLTGLLFGLLRQVLPSLKPVKSEWLLLLSSGISLVLIGVYICMDKRKWHIGETLRRLREGHEQDSPKK
jgi:hypothetical protein